MRGTLEASFALLALASATVGGCGGSGTTLRGAGPSGGTDATGGGAGAGLAGEPPGTSGAEAFGGERSAGGAAGNGPGHGGSDVAGSSGDGGWPAAGGAVPGGRAGGGSTASDGGAAGMGGTAGMAGTAVAGATAAAGGSAGSSGGEDVPNTAACATYREDDVWMPEWSAIEAEVLALINAERAAGTDCPDGSGGTVTMDPQSALSMHPELRCAARAHSYDMATRDYYSNGTWNENGDACTGLGDTCPTAGYICRQRISGTDPYRCLEGASLRIARAGYDHNGYFEGIGANHPAARDLVSAWMEHPSLCPGVMSDGFVDVGVGYTPGPGPGESRWTVILSVSP